MEVTLEELKLLPLHDLRNYIIEYTKSFSNINISNECIVFILEKADELNNEYDIYERIMKTGIDEPYEFIDVGNLMNHIIENDNAELIELINNNDLDYCLELMIISINRRKKRIFLYLMKGLYPLKQNEAKYIISNLMFTPKDFCMDDIHYILEKSKDYGY